MNDKQRENCRKKDPYDTEEQARLAASVQMQQWVSPDIRTYECPVCGLWHFTSQAPREDDQA